MKKVKKVDEAVLAVLLRSYLKNAMTDEEATATVGKIVVVCRNGDAIGTAINVDELARVMDKAIAWGRDYLNQQDSSTDSYPMLTDMRKYIMDDLFDRVTGEQFADNLSDCTVDLIMNWYWASRK